MKVAALDLGTNSFLLLIVEEDRKGLRRVLHDESVIVRLGEGLLQSGRIKEEALVRAEACLSAFRETLDHHQPIVVQAVTTAAARDAENAQEFLSLCEDYEIPVVTLTGDEEARMSYFGAVPADEKNPCCVIDIGGGSTETIVGLKGKIQFAKSLSYGAVKMTEKFILQQPTPVQQITALRTHLQKISEETWAQVEALSPQKIIAVAGTPTTLAACVLGKFDADRVEGFRLSKSDLQKWIEIFAELSIEEKKSRYPLGKRADVILAGSLILYEFLNRIGSEEIFVSTKGIRYGLAETLLLRSSQ